MQSLFVLCCLCVSVACAGSEPGTPRVVKTKTGSEMVLIPAGSFKMGSPAGSIEESPVHEVWIDSFFMDRCEVTQGRYLKLAGENPSSFPGAGNPVETVEWIGAVTYCNLRSRAEGLKPCYAGKGREWTCDFGASGYRLPTEAEWEYACRAGARTAYCFGSDAGRLPDFAWFGDNAGKRTHPVGRKRPNAWGLCDMHGNVSEWCNDALSRIYYKNCPLRNPPGPKTGEIKVVRGGGWSSTADACRSARRTGENARVIDSCITDSIGFRCVRKAPETNTAGQ